MSQDDLPAETNLDFSTNKIIFFHNFPLFFSEKNFLSVWNSKTFQNKCSYLPAETNIFCSQKCFFVKNKVSAKLSHFQNSCFPLHGAYPLVQSLLGLLPSRVLFFFWRHICFFVAYQGNSLSITPPYHKCLKKQGGIWRSFSIFKKPRPVFFFRNTFDFLKIFKTISISKKLRPFFLGTRLIFWKFSKKIRFQKSRDFFFV